MIILKLCSIAVVTAVCAIILKTQKSDLVPLVLTAGGILLILCGFDYFAESVEFLKQFSQQTNIDTSVIKLIIKVIGVGYLIELTASSIKDLGFASLSDKLLVCGKIIIFVMSIPVLNALFEVISKLIKLS
ncbi:MAG: stage III sporulation AC/AD family protein [Candidatus Coproplasma sp.]